jgi:hypothetical protein
MKKMIFRLLVLALLLGALSFQAWSPVSADSMTCPTPTPVTIDIKPGSYPNSINLSSKGVVAVAVLTTPAFDASQFTPAMAHLTDANTTMTMPCTGTMAVRYALEDVNGDGLSDLVFFFKTQDLNLTPSSTAATLMAHGSYSSTTLHIMGTDSVNIVP